MAEHDRATRAPTISVEYLAVQQEMHKNPHYGIASLQFAPSVKEIIGAYGIKSVSDYGAGKCNLRVGLNQLGVAGFDYFPFDPAFPEYGPPRPADLVCCIDVLEHIEPEFLDAVLRDLERLVVRYGFFSVATMPALKQLPDGRNTHLIVQPPAWWLPKLRAHFAISKLQQVQHGFLVLVEPKGKPAAP
jgi:hypothetical protein